jgi:hypothetical protein
MRERFDFEVDEEPVKEPGPRFNVLDLFTILALLTAAFMAAFMAYVFFFPHTSLNPLKPRIPTPFNFPTATITPLQLEATWTPTVVFATDTPTLAPTITLMPSPTSISLVPPTKTPPASATPRAPYGATITPIESTIIHPEEGCGWFGIGGSVVDSSNAPVLYMTLRLTGSINGEPVEKLTVSGTALDYGQSGFEFELGNSPVASNHLLTLQLFNQAGERQADDIPIVTYDDCKKNLILVRFKGR